MTEQYIGSFVGHRGEPQVFFNDMKRVGYRVLTEMFSDRYDSWTEETRLRAPIHDSDVISSEIVGSKLHAPVIDIDVPLRALPSSTPDHWHLYIEKPMTWWRYKRLLRALVRAGLVEKGYYRASIARRGTHVRLPWVTKQKGQ